MRHHQHRHNPPATNPMLYAVIGGLVALVLAIGGWVGYKEITRQNEQEVASMVEQARGMTNEEMRHYKGDNPIILNEKARRNKELHETINLYQNRH